DEPPGEKPLNPRNSAYSHYVTLGSDKRRYGPRTDQSSDRSRTCSGPYSSGTRPEERGDASWRPDLCSACTLRRERSQRSYSCLGPQDERGRDFEHSTGPGDP